MTTAATTDENTNITNTSNVNKEGTTTRAPRWNRLVTAIAAGMAATTAAAALSFGAFADSASAAPYPAPVHVAKAPAVRSASVAKLQRELAQLNYYIGPIDGIMGPQTIAAITYLQRDAHLPANRPHEPQNRSCTGLLPGPWQQPHGGLAMHRRPARTPAGRSLPPVFTYASSGKRWNCPGENGPVGRRPAVVAPLVSVVVVDDHPFFRDGVSRGLTLDGRCRVVGEAGSGREALEAIRDQDPDVALVDFQMPDMDGIAVVHALKRDGSRTRVLLVSAITDGAIVFRALEEGAAGYLSKEASRSELIEAVLKVSRGETVIPGDLAGAVAAQIRLRAQPAAPVLSPREREVLQGFARGLSIPSWRPRCSWPRAP